MLQKSVVLALLARLSVLSLCIGLGGCGGSQTTDGPDEPLTSARLTSTMLTDINGDLTWKFAESEVVIENKQLPIPTEFMNDIFGGEMACNKIEASWQLDETAGKLQLTKVTIDGQESDFEASIPISGAGHIRANLGDRQYNLSREQPKTK